VARTPALSLKGVSAADDYGRPALKSIDLTVGAGEILGIAGVAGNGQKELSEVLTGLRPVTAGEILINGEGVRSLDPATFTGLGVGHIPEDRLRSGLAPALSVTDNAVLREYKGGPVLHGPVFSPRAATRVARAIAAAANVMVPDFAMPVRNLSGGNQQRLVARREMRIAETVLIAAYPSRGLDVGAINTMLRYFVELRDRGVAVVLISEELEELFNLSDRIAVLYEGRIMGIFLTEQADLETIGLLMGGQAQQPAAAVK
jgi:simple sugar transport system ATP-binding protein